MYDKKSSVPLLELMLMRGVMLFSGSVGFVHGIMHAQGSLEYSGFWAIAVPTLASSIVYGGYASLGLEGRLGEDIKQSVLSNDEKTREIIVCSEVGAVLGCSTSMLGYGAGYLIGWLMK